MGLGTEDLSLSQAPNNLASGEGLWFRTVGFRV